MKFTNPINFITSNYDRYILYEKYTEPNERRLDLHVIELESYAGLVKLLKDMVMKGINSTSNTIRVISMSSFYILEQVYNLIVNRNLSSVW